MNVKKKGIKRWWSKQSPKAKKSWYITLVIVIVAWGMLYKFTGTTDQTRASSVKVPKDYAEQESGTAVNADGDGTSDFEQKQAIHNAEVKRMESANKRGESYLPNFSALELKQQKEPDISKEIGIGNEEISSIPVEKEKEPEQEITTVGKPPRDISAEEVLGIKRPEAKPEDTKVSKANSQSHQKSTRGHIDSSSSTNDTNDGSSEKKGTTGKDERIATRVAMLKALYQQEKLKGGEEVSVSYFASSSTTSGTIRNTLNRNTSQANTQSRSGSVQNQSGSQAKNALTANRSVGSQQSNSISTGIVNGVVTAATGSPAAGGVAANVVGAAMSNGTMANGAMSNGTMPNSAMANTSYMQQQQIAQVDSNTPATFTPGDMLLIKPSNYVNSDESPSTIFFEVILPLEMEGYVIMAKQVRNNGVFNIQTESISHDGLTAPFSGMVVTADGKRNTGIASDTDWHTAYRWSMLIGGSALAGAGDAYLDSNDSVTTDGSTTTVTNERKAADVLYGVAKGVGDKLSDIAVDEFKTPPTVTLDPQITPILAVMITSSIRISWLPKISEKPKA